MGTRIVGAKAGSVVLPPEIISEVIANINITEMTYPQIANLWVAACQVSKQFAQEIPKALGHKLLGEIAIEYKIGTFMYLASELLNSLFTGHRVVEKDYPDCSMFTQNERDELGELNMSLGFCRFSEDGVTAFFKASSSMNVEAGFASPPFPRTQTVFFKALKYYNRRYPSFAEGPFHLTYLHGVFNDVGLPGFSVDIAKQELGLDWKQLFQKLFSEDAYCTSELPTSSIRDFSASSFSSTVINGGLGAYAQMQNNCRKRRFENWLARTSARKNSPMVKDLPEDFYQYSLATYGYKVEWVRTRMKCFEDGEYSQFKYWAQRTYGNLEGDYEDGEGQSSELGIGEETEFDHQEGSNTNEGEDRKEEDWWGELS